MGKSKHELHGSRLSAPSKGGSVSGIKIERPSKQLAPGQIFHPVRDKSPHGDSSRAFGRAVSNGVQPGEATKLASEPIKSTTTSTTGMEALEITPAETAPQLEPSSHQEPLQISEPAFGGRSRILKLVFSWLAVILLILGATLAIIYFNKI